jgi:hypothetical protein
MDAPRATRRQLTESDLIARLHHELSRDGFVYVGNPAYEHDERDKAIALHVMAGEFAGMQKKALIQDVMDAAGLGRRQVFNILKEHGPRLSFGISGAGLLIEPEFTAPASSDRCGPSLCSGTGIEW